MRLLASIRSTASRLAHDEGGNTLILVGMAVLPLIAMMGGALDIARTQLAKSRMSQACDAAALAGRRAMSNEDISTAIPEATKFFNYNFPQGYMQTAAFTPTITRPDTGVVKVAASTTVPTTLMRIFGHGSIAISVDCDATQNFDNIDIVLVLDVTGSMDDSLSGQKKIVSLRQAVMALYDELASAQTQLAAQGLRLRYGIVPYSETVNVGQLIRAVNPTYMASEWSYPSRRFNAPTGQYVYEIRTFNVESFTAGASVNGGALTNSSNNFETWTGCIEERQTTVMSASGGTAVSNIPSGANDLNIDLIPTSDNSTRWGPQWADVQWRANGSGGSQIGNDCPAASSRLATRTRAEMQSSVDALVPTGSTYHDIGMIWGARLISRGGIFGADNPTTFNDRPVNRYVIFMSDGMMDPDSQSGGAYGAEQWNRRIVGGTYGVTVGHAQNSDLANRHSRRFVMACNAAKQGGASVWSIAFGMSVPTSMASCASSSDQTATSANSAQLIAKFREIGKNIGALRLSQ